MTRAGGSIARLRRFPGAREGVAAIEFAFIAPILIFFYLGMAETCQLIMAQRRVSHAAAALADVVTQDTDIGAVEMLEIFEAGCTIMSPFPTEDMPGKLRLRVTSVYKNAAGANKVDWSRNNGRGFTQLSRDDDPPFVVATPLATSDTVIVSEVAYTYKSSVGFLMSTKNVVHKSEMRPRRSPSVTYTAAATAAPAMSCSD